MGIGLRTSATQWGALAKSFHRAGAALTIFLLAFGWWMIHLGARAGDKACHDLAEDIHRVLSYTLLVLMIGHVVATLRHHYVKKNDILRRMM